MKIYLIGNPNSGKTTLYNLLTGKSERVGNRTGVTTEGRSARVLSRYAKGVTVTDLPGAYSLSGKTADERAVTDAFKEKPDLIINVADACNPLRSLMLTAELSALGIPVVVAFNMSDEAEKRGIKTDIKRVSEFFRTPALFISARKNRGITELLSFAQKQVLPPKRRTAEETGALKDAVTLKKREITFSEKADRLLMNAKYGIPVFVFLMTAVFCLTSVIGGGLGKAISEWGNSLIAVCNEGLKNSGSTAVFRGLICDGALKGIIEGASFLPQLLVLTFLLTVFEETGYLSRVAFLFDGITGRFGFGGKSLVSFGISCGCAVNGITATRIIENDGERVRTALLTSCMPCGAKTAVISWLGGLVFGGNPLITASVYFISVAFICLAGATLKRLKRFKGSTAGMIMEIPALKVPALKTLLLSAKNKAGEFTLKVCSSILLISVILWALMSFGVNGYTENVSESFLFFIGNGIKFVFYPLGFGTWQTSVATISGFFAKEGVAETLALISDPKTLFRDGYAAYSFAVFTVLSPACVSAQTTALSEVKDRKTYFTALGLQTGFAYLICALINLFGKCVSGGILPAICLTTLIIGIIISLKATLKKGRCALCDRCGKTKCKAKAKVNTTI